MPQFEINGVDMLPYTSKIDIEIKGEAKLTPEEKIQKAVTLIISYGEYDGAHHKDWVLDQALRCLMDTEAYNDMRAELERSDCLYEEGIAP